MSLPAGTQIGPYEVIGLLGEGGMGQVYRGRDPRLGREIAIKILQSDSSKDAEALGRFEREARAVASLSHPNIIAVHDFGEFDGTFFVVTELLEGQTLRDRLLESSVPWRKAVDIGAEIAEGLAAAHARSIVHRDLKPENIFMTADGRVKILDFGLAQTDPLLSTRNETVIPTTKWFQTHPGTVVGTLGYMSPEQLRGETVDARTDIFALGCILDEMISDGPPALKRIIDRCLEKDRNARYHSARDLAIDLRSMTHAPKRTRWALWGLGAVIIAVAIVLTYKKPAAPAHQLRPVPRPRRDRRHPPRRRPLTDGGDPGVRAGRHDVDAPVLDVGEGAAGGAAGGVTAGGEAAVDIASLTSSAPDVLSCLA